MRAPKMAGSARVRNAGEVEQRPNIFTDLSNECSTPSGALRATVYYSIIILFVGGLLCGLGAVIYYTTTMKEIDKTKEVDDELEQLMKNSKQKLDHLFFSSTANVEQLISIYSTELEERFQDIGYDALDIHKQQQIKDNVLEETHGKALDFEMLGRNFLTFRSNLDIRNGIISRNYTNGFMLALKPNDGLSGENNLNDTALELYLELANGDSHKMAWDYRGMPKLISASINMQLAQFNFIWPRALHLNSTKMVGIVTDLRGFTLEKRKTSRIMTPFLEQNLKMINQNQLDKLKDRNYAEMVRLEKVSKSRKFYKKYREGNQCQDKLKIQSYLCEGRRCISPNKIYSSISLISDDLISVRSKPETLEMRENGMGAIEATSECQEDFDKMCENSHVYKIPSDQVPDLGKSNFELNMVPKEMDELPEKINDLYRRMGDILDYVICPSNVFIRCGRF